MVRVNLVCWDGTCLPAAAYAILLVACFDVFDLEFLPPPKPPTCDQAGGYWTCEDRYNPGHLVQHKWENCMYVIRVHHKLV